jgi:hypothetical protein
MAKDGTTEQTDVTLEAAKAQTPQTISLVDHEKILRDKTSAIMADVGRQKAEAERALKAATDAQARLDKLEQDRIQAELEAAKGDPDKLSVIQERQKRRQIESELDKARQELTDKTTKLQSYESKDAESAREKQAREIATKLNVDPAKLVKLARFTDGSADAIEEIAKELPKTGKASFRADSNAHVGGSLSFEQIRADFIKNPRDPAIRARYYEAKRH